MTTAKTTNIWTIEEQKTVRIYLLLGLLALIHFIGIWLIWLVIKAIIHLRLEFFDPRLKFHLFGWDTLWIMLLAVCITGLHWYVTNQRAVSRILGLLRAQGPDPQDKYHRIFSNIVDEIESAAGGRQVERYILPTGALNAFAVADTQGRMAIGVTEGLISRLDRGEIQSVVAHEMAHIVSGDCQFITLSTALFGLYEEALSQVTRVNRDLATSETERRNAASSALASIPIFIVIFILENLSQFLNLVVSRQREYRADAAAARYTRDPLSLASALYKIAGRWRGAGLEGDHLANIFILSPDLKQIEERDGFLANLFSTHPPVGRRIEIMLGLGHADPTVLYKKFREGSAIVPDDKAIAEPRFMVEQKGAWTGPFTIRQLLTVDGLEPVTKLRLENTETGLTAAELPGLADFFKVRDLPVWKIRRLCPRCRQWLVVEDYEGLILLECAFCHGVLVDADKLPRIFARTERPFSESVQRTAETLWKESQRRHRFSLLIETSQPHHCPRCGKPMTRKFYSFAYHVEVDECEACRAVWFDENELEILQCLIEIAEKKAVELEKGGL